MRKRTIITLLSIIIITLIYANYPISSLPDTIYIDKIVVKKAERKLFLIKDGIPIKDYNIVLGKNPIGHKLRRGDSKTPEGTYFIDYRNAESLFYLSLHISYPNQYDKLQAQKKGFDPGGQIMIHGIKNGIGFIGRLHTLYDWTDGCIGVTNPEIEEIWRVTPNGTPIEIKI